MKTNRKVAGYIPPRMKFVMLRKSKALCNTSFSLDDMRESEDEWDRVRN